MKCNKCGKQIEEYEIILTRQEQVEKDFLNEFLFTEENR